MCLEENRPPRTSLAEPQMGLRKLARHDPRTHYTTDYSSLTWLGTWNVERGTWDMGHETWAMEHETRNTKHETWNIEHENETTRESQAKRAPVGTVLTFPRVTFGHPWKPGPTWKPFRLRFHGCPFAPTFPRRTGFHGCPMRGGFHVGPCHLGFHGCPIRGGFHVGPCHLGFHVRLFLRARV